MLSNHLGHHDVRHRYEVLATPLVHDLEPLHAPFVAHGLEDAEDLGVAALVRQPVAEAEPAAYVGAVIDRYSPRSSAGA